MFAGKGTASDNFAIADGLEYVLGRLAATTYRILDLPGTATLATISPVDVFIDRDGAYFTTPDASGNITLTLPATGLRLTMEAQAARALMVLHELGHQLGVLFTPDAGNVGLNEANTRRVLEGCFTIGSDGVWR